MQRQGSNDEPCSHVGELRVESAVRAGAELRMEGAHIQRIAAADAAAKPAAPVVATMPEFSEGQGIECGAGMRVKVEGALCDQLVC